MSEEQIAFDLDKGLALKEIGMNLAADSKSANLTLAKEIAIQIALKDPNQECNIDLVQMIVIPMGIVLGNSAGSVFKDKRWEFSGKWIPSSRISNHGHSVRVWRLR
jgi:hypothetical protein